MIEIVIPESIKVGGYTYKILTGSEVDHTLRGDGNFADHCFITQEIRVGSDLGADHLSNGFIHEVLHAIDKIYNAAELDHKLIDGMTNGLHQVLEQLGIRFVLKEG